MAKKKTKPVPTNSDPPEKEDCCAACCTATTTATTIIILLTILIPFISLVVYQFKQRIPIKPIDLSVYERGLVRISTNYNEILTENSRVSENALRRRLHPYPTLGYITPWNAKGYEFAKRFNSKFTHLSPVWYDLKSEGSRFILQGRHNADVAWIKDLRKSGDALVLPRIVLEVFPNELLKKKKRREEAINLILEECKEMDYDGIVLESWSRWAAYGVLQDPEMRSKALQFVKELGKALHSVNSERNDESWLLLVYVIGPPSSINLQEHDFGPEDLKSLSNAVDGFSLMTYDFSGPQKPGPNAPLKWITSVLQVLLSGSGGNSKDLAHKIFLGINFYGNDFAVSEGGGGAIVGMEYLSLLEKYKPAVHWDEKSEEHMFMYTDNKGTKHTVFYPSLMSISKRLEEARQWGAGISIWEIGQGLDYFFDLL
ncbi:hypothetical protein C5167_047634 [Papaver somniferum]|uniref:Chitinase domain-containing protein 1 n=1 Tax=Papaver somniferum TaxID=3469 RepID=A0A4Y7LKU6_PAPSO|nr:chitinase domain-containing protein 1-like [Papaver somniferum]RZC84851.1 hypothetical protein C5167_047634 [Papaver somniferum]